VGLPALHHQQVFRSRPAVIRSERPGDGFQFGRLPVGPGPVEDRQNLLADDPGGTVAVKPTLEFN
jgi:hypothetical protein